MQGVRVAISPLAKTLAECIESSYLLLNGDVDGETRGHLSLDEARAAFDASGAKKLLITHRPDELDAPDDVELAYDGLVRSV